MDTNQFLEKLNAIVNEYSECLKTAEASRQSAQDNDNSDVYNETAGIARLNPFKGHILCDKTEMIQNSYIAALIAIFSDETDSSVRTQQLLITGRIIASFKPDYNLRDYVTASLKINDRFWENFTEFMDKNLAFSFAVDALVIGKIHSEKVSRNVFVKIADILQMLNLSKNEIQHAALIAQSILKQDFKEFIKSVKPVNDINYSCFLGYFPDADFPYISGDILACKDVKGKILIANAILENSEEVLDIDKFAADEIKFFNCSFYNTRGIVSLNKKTEFEECVFERNLINEQSFEKDLKKDSLGFLWNAITYRGSSLEKGYVFLNIKNSNFIKSRISDCQVRKPLIDAEQVNFTDCVFENCKGIDFPHTYLLNLKLGDITRCKFENCQIETYKTDLPITTGGIVCVERGSVKESSFINCLSYGDSGYGSYAEYEMQILWVINSKVNNCSFTSCKCTSYYSTRRTVTSYILGMTNSNEKNNEFTECESYHYEYSDSRGSQHNIGNI